MNAVAVMDKPAEMPPKPFIHEEEAEQKVVLPFEKKGEYFVEQVGEIPKKPIYATIKRIFDIFASAVALIILAIPMAFIAMMIKIKSPGPVFYHQERLGLNGKKIDIIKFRTMNVDAEANGAQWSQGDEDPRISLLAEHSESLDLTSFRSWRRYLPGSSVGWARGLSVKFSMTNLKLTSMGFTSV